MSSFSILGPDQQGLQHHWWQIACCQNKSELECILRLLVVVLLICTAILVLWVPRGPIKTAETAFARFPEAVGRPHSE